MRRISPETVLFAFTGMRVEASADLATNESSLEAALENTDVARPLVIYAEERAAGFTMFAFGEEYEDPNDRYWLWRFMIDENLQGRGIGKEALKLIISYFKENLIIERCECITNASFKGS